MILPSVHQKICKNHLQYKKKSITLSSVIIAIIVLYSFVIEHYKDTIIFANHQIYR